MYYSIKSYFNYENRFFYILKETTNLKPIDEILENPEDVYNLREILGDPTNENFYSKLLHVSQNKSKIDKIFNIELKEFLNDELDALLMKNPIPEDFEQDFVITDSEVQEGLLQSNQNINNAINLRGIIKSIK